MTSLDIAWVSGIVEGEGYLSSRNGSPSIKVSMTDADVVQRLCSVWGVRMSGPYKPRGNQTREVWTATVHGYRAVGWMMTLYTFLGVRRRAAAAAAVAKWVAAPGHARKVRGVDGTVLPALCHPDRPLHARQMCRQCYGQKFMKAWRHRTGRNSRYYRSRKAAA